MRAALPLPALPVPESSAAAMPPVAAEHPIPADIAEAEAAYDAFAGRFGMAHDRADYVARLARAAMQKRINSEHRASLSHPSRFGRGEETQMKEVA